MGFSKEWDQIYQASQQMSIYPWSEVVSFVMRFARPLSAETTVLELGCGAGANISFFKNLGVRYYAIEGSPHIVEKLKDRFPDLKNQLVAGDFTEGIPFDFTFDLIVDRSSLTHNTTAAIRKTLANCHAHLNPGGKYLGIDWFSTHHSEFEKAQTHLDSNTRKDFTSGPFSSVGAVHFSDQPHLQDLFSSFVFERLEHKIIETLIPHENFRLATWNFLCRKD